MLRTVHRKMCVVKLVHNH